MNPKSFLLTGFALRLTLGLTLLLAPGNRSAEHLLLHEVAEGSWVPLGLLGGAETAFRLVDLMEYGLGLLLLVGCFTRWTALATAALFASFIAGIGLVELNRDVGLLVGAAALALLGDSGWSADHWLQSRWKFPSRAEAWLGGHMARLPSGTPSLLLRAGLAFTLLATGVLLFRGMASFGSPIFHDPQPAPLLAIAELALGLLLLSGWRPREAAVATGSYFALLLLWLGFETQMRSLALAGCGGALWFLDGLEPQLVDFQRLWREGWSRSPFRTRAGAAGIAILAVMATAPALVWEAAEMEDHHEIYFELYTVELAYAFQANEGQIVSESVTVNASNLTYLVFNLAVQDSDGEPDSVSLDSSSPDGFSQSGSTTEQLELLFQLGNLPPQGNLPEAEGAKYQHTNGTGLWTFDMQCEDAPGTVVVVDLGDDGQCDWMLTIGYQYFESHVAEHGH